MAQVLLLSWRGSASAESFSRPCCCAGPWKPQRDSLVENLIALFSLLLLALLAMLKAALHFDSSPKELGEDGMLTNVHFLFFLINTLKNNAQIAAVLGHAAFIPLLKRTQVIQGWKEKTTFSHIFCSAV